MVHIITLLTDFGTNDSYVAQMKGVILGIAPECHLVDVTHQVPPQDVGTGALVLREVAGVFPPGTIHIAVVDPGVGTGRRIIVAESASQLFVLPDNGLLTYVERDLVIQRAFVVENSTCWRQPVSPTFHGRDIIAPVAANLANGVPIESLGPRVGRLVRIDGEDDGLDCRSWISGEASPLNVELRVIAVDHFGNLVTNAKAEYRAGMFLKRSEFWVQAGVKSHLVRMVRTYGEARPGELVVLVGSQGRLELAVVNGSAASQLGVVRGQALVFRGE